MAEPLLLEELNQTPEAANAASTPNTASTPNSRSAGCRGAREGR